MKLRASTNNHNEFVITPCGLLKSEQLELQSDFKKSQTKGQGISFYDFIRILRTYFEIKQFRKQQLRQQILDKGVKIIDLSYLITTAAIIKKQKQENYSNINQQNSQYCRLLINKDDAFIALGGNPDGSGFITRETLIKTITKEFQLPFDDNSPLQGLQAIQNQRLNFEQFCLMLDSSSKTTNQDVLRRVDSHKSVQINAEQFYRYLSKLQLIQ